MSNNKRKQLIDALLDVQPLLVCESARYSRAELKEYTDAYLIVIATNFLSLHNDYIVQKAKAGEDMSMYSKHKRLLKKIEYLI